MGNAISILCVSLVVKWLYACGSNIGVQGGCEGPPIVKKLDMFDQELVCNWRLGASQENWQVFAKTEGTQRYKHAETAEEKHFNISNKDIYLTADSSNGAYTSVYALVSHFVYVLWTELQR